VYETEQEIELLHPVGLRYHFREELPHYIVCGKPVAETVNTILLEQWQQCPSPEHIPERKIQKEAVIDVKPGSNCLVILR
jgi:hypothetical protein